MHENYSGFQFTMTKEWKSDMVQYAWEKIAEKLGIAENSILLRKVQKQLSVDVLAYIH